MPNPTDRSGGLQVDTPEINPSSYWHAVDVSSVDAPLTGVRAIFVGGAGNLVLTDQAGNDVTFAVVAGQLLPVRPSIVRHASTTATNLVALY